MASVHVIFCTVALIVSAASHISANSYFRIDVVDGETGRGVPLVQLRTSSYISYYTDSNGIVAFDEPGLLGLPVYFVVLSDGYTYAGSWPGTPSNDPGILLETHAGGQATIIVNRTQHAERLYRMTGGGIYRDSVLVGQPAPIDFPLLGPAGVLGQDSLLAATYKGKAYWFFGDTECPAGPRSTDCQHYGRFTTGAVSCIPGADQGCAVPPSLHYFMSNDSHAPGGMASNGKPSEELLRLWNPKGFAHPKAILAGPPDANGVRLYNQSTWVGSVAVIKEGTEERMYTSYFCPPNWPQGIAQWDDDKEMFVSILTAAWLPGIQWVMKTKPEDGDYIYYANPFVNARVPAKFASIANLSHYEFFSPCDSVLGAGLSNCSRQMNASSWRWQKSNIDGAPGVGIFGPDEESAAIKKGLLSPQDARMQVKDAIGGLHIQHGLARGSVNWNAYRQKYVLIADKGMVDAGGQNGESNYGELWYCESSSITGPWGACTKIITHEGTGTSCYNPLQLAFMDEQHGRVIYIACTWTSMWSGQRTSPNDAACKFADYGGQGCAVAVPRYEYNNIVFRLNVTKMTSRSSWAIVI